MKSLLNISCLRISLCILFCLAGTSFIYTLYAQIPDRVFKTDSRIDPEKKGELSVEIDNLSFFKDDEYTGSFMKGERGDFYYIGWGGGIILFAGLFDMMDGQVARIGKMSSTFGALYDSVLDRYSELTVFFGICFYLINQGYVISSIVAFIALIGSLMVSYVRARAEGLGLECKVGFMQRPERVVLTGLGALCCGIFAPMMENNEIFEPIMIFVIPLLIVAIFSNITAFARLNHCRKLLSSKDNE